MWPNTYREWRRVRRWSSGGRLAAARRLRVLGLDWRLGRDGDETWILGTGFPKKQAAEFIILPHVHCVILSNLETQRRDHQRIIRKIEVSGNVRDKARDGELLGRFLRIAIWPDHHVPTHQHLDLDIEFKRLSLSINNTNKQAKQKVKHHIVNMEKCERWMLTDSDLGSATSLSTRMADSESSSWMSISSGNCQFK